MTKLAPTESQNPYLGDMNLQNLIGGFLVFIIMNSVLLTERRGDFKTFYALTLYTLWGKSHEIYNFYNLQFLLPPKMHHTKF